jgi:hypothetical protein
MVMGRDWVELKSLKIVNPPPLEALLPGVVLLAIMGTRSFRKKDLDSAGEA